MCITLTYNIFTLLEIFDRNFLSRYPYIKLTQKGQFLHLRRTKRFYKVIFKHKIGDLLEHNVTITNKRLIKSGWYWMSSECFYQINFSDSCMKCWWSFINRGTILGVIFAELQIFTSSAVTKVQVLESIDTESDDKNCGYSISILFRFSCRYTFKILF